MYKNIPKEIIDISSKLKVVGFNSYIVGGAVRDLLLGREVKDWDLTTDATPEEILKVFPDGFYENTFGTVGVKTSLGVVEVTTMRNEGNYQDSRRPTDLSWTNEIEEDLKRRDFTINALALTVEDELIDPFNGKKDLDQKIIKTVGDPENRFKEDALRLMRAIRFAVTLGFTIEPKTFDAIKVNSKNITKISWERVRDELLKILASEYPYEGMLMLRSSGLLEYILPEIEKCFGILQEGPKHDRIYDIGDHSFKSLKFCSSNDPIVRFACLIHDVGKVNTYKVDHTGNATFYGHDVIGGKVAEQITKRLRFSKKEIEKVVKLVRFHLFTVDEHQTDSAIRRFIKNIGMENLEDMFILREADRLGGASNPTSWRTEHFKERIKQVLEKPFSVSDLKINGEDVMRELNIKPSRRVGEILEELFGEVSKDKSKNTREHLLDRLKTLS